MKVPEKFEINVTWWDSVIPYKTKDNHCQPDLPLPIRSSEHDIACKFAKHFVNQEVKVKGYINCHGNKHKFNLKIWLFKKFIPTNKFEQQYKNIAYVIKGNISPFGIDTKITRWANKSKNVHEDIILISPQGYSAQLKKRHKLHSKELKFTEKLLDSVANYSLEDDAFVFAYPALSLRIEEFLPIFVRIWFAFYGYFEICRT